MPKVVSMSSVRELLIHWEKVRQRILAGRVTGVQTVIIEDEDEELLVSGVFAKSPVRSARASLRMSAARVLQEDEPPVFQVRRRQ